MLFSATATFVYLAVSELPTKRRENHFRIMKYSPRNDARAVRSGLQASTVARRRNVVEDWPSKARGSQERPGVVPQSKSPISALSPRGKIGGVNILAFEWHAIGQLGALAPRTDRGVHLDDDTSIEWYWREAH